MRRAFIIEGLRLTEALDRRSAPVLLTGTALTPDQLVTHCPSELVLH